MIGSLLRSLPRDGFGSTGNVSLAAVASLVLIGGLAATDRARAAVPSPSPLVLAQASDRNLSRALWGQWFAPGGLAGQDLTFVFTPDGTLHFIVTLPRGRMAAQEFSYRVAPGSPLHLDLTLPDGSVVPTVAEVTPEGRLRVQIDGTNPDRPRPQQLSETATVFDRLSDSTALPTSLVEANTLDDLFTLSRRQRTYYLEFRTFADSIAALNADVPSETDDYRFAIVFEGDRSDSVRITATAKRADLHSFTSGVFMVPNERGLEISTMAVCRSDNPTSEAPPMPVPPPDSSGEVTCAPGSHRIRR
ncbi:type IV pilin-like G/H family protein [Baaleninema simplex]|uniref:type IV pilin-like G/H family protein n=1 Tax=Baaleninema simplex TaxID=2862350 RepID=UPI000347FD1B|nr:type IV pilin-like G/H family protein [Baaleninema simplex]